MVCLQTETGVNCRPKWHQKQAQIVTNQSKTQSDNSMLLQELITKNGNPHSGYVTTTKMRTAAYSKRGENLVVSQQLLNPGSELLTFLQVTQAILHKRLHIPHFLTAVIAVARHQHGIN